MYGTIFFFNDTATTEIYTLSLHDALLISASGYNDGKFNNARVDELLAMAKTAADPQPLYTEIEQIIAAEVPIIPIYHYAGVLMLDSDLGGWPIQNVEQNWYSRDLYKIAE